MPAFARFLTIVTSVHPLTSCPKKKETFDMKNTALLCILLPLSGLVFAQKKPVVVPPKNPTTATTAGLFSGVKQGPKPYSEVITDKAVTQTGLFIIHKVEDKYFFEIHDSIMGREI